MAGAVSVSSSASGATRDGAVDVAVTAVVVALSLVLLAHGGLALPNPHHADTSVVPAVLTVAAAAPLLLWRRLPLVTVLVAAAVSVVLAASGGLVWPPLGIATATFCFARGPRTGSRWPRRHQLTAAAAVLTFLMVAALVSPLAPVFHSAIACAALWFAGERSRLRRSEMHELRAEAVRREREAARERELAVLEERARIARDLHDTTAHALNVITLRAGTARMRNDDSHARGVLADIEQLARDTITDVDRVVTALRSPDAAVEAPPGLAALDGLVRQHRANGHEIQVVVVGTTGELPGRIDQGVFRILQEALTNATRHGAGGAHVHLEYGDHLFAAEVHNRVDHPVGERLVGHGLIGMRERASAIGAELTLEEASSGFALRLRVRWAEGE